MKVGLKTNIILDVAMFIAMVVTSFSGIVIKVIAPLRRFANEEWVREAASWFFYGCSRGTWKQIHLWAGVILLVLLVLHILFHWSMVDAFFKKHIPNNSWRGVLYGVLFVLSLISIIPWLWAF